MPLHRVGIGTVTDNYRDWVFRTDDHISEIDIPEIHSLTRKKSVRSELNLGSRGGRRRIWIRFGERRRGRIAHCFGRRRSRFVWRGFN